MAIAPLRRTDSRRDADKSNEGGTTQDEQAQVRERAPASALVVHEVIRHEGDEELRRSASQLAFSGLAAGLSMGFSLVAEGTLRAMLPEAAHWRPLVSKLGYSVGFVIVVLGRQQLFTENTLTPILPLLNNRDRATLIKVLRLWAIVLASNLVGAFLFALTIAKTPAFPPDVASAFHKIGVESLAGGFGLHLLRGIFAGWLIALMVWLLPSAEQARLHIIILLTWLVAVSGLSHIIAGSIETLYLVCAGAASWGAYWEQFMVPTLIGNIIGGTLLVAALNFGQVASETSGKGK